MDYVLAMPFWLWRLILAVLLGGLIGWERQVHGRPAGLRTHILVCLGAALMTLAGILMAAGAAAAGETVRLDPTRIAAAIITGIGFLGAGAILRSGDAIRGLTTAASLWFTAGLGVVVGFGFIALAATATALALLALVGLVYVERRAPR